jgi:hypothetical protein
LASWAEGIVPRTPKQFVLTILVVGPLLLFGEGILQGVAYFVARLMLPLLTVGYVRVESMHEDTSFPWHGVSHAPDGKYIVSADASSVVGLVILVAAIAIGVVVYHYVAT